MPGVVLIVEDEPELAGVLEYNLSAEGFRVLLATDGSTALRLSRQKPRPDLVLLDLLLPDISGLEVCRRLKADPETQRIPVIIQSVQGEEVDRVVGFEVGADDYVVKPYSLRELMLRVRALRRRCQDRSVEVGSRLVFGDLEVDIVRHQVFFQGEEVVLTALEFRLLTTLLMRRGRVQSRRVLLDEVWGMRGDAQTRTVDTHIKRLRQKLGAAGDYIETLRGVGYRFKPSASRPTSALKVD